MSEGSPNDVPRTAGLVLFVLFLGLVGVGIATVILPEIATTPESAGADAGAGETVD